MWEEIKDMRNNIYRFLGICIELADLVDENGESGQEIFNKDLHMGYRVLSGYLRSGAQEVIALMSKYHSAVIDRQLAETGEREAHDFLEEVFGDREPYTINDKDKERIKAFVKSIMDEWEKETEDT